MEGKLLKTLKRLSQLDVLHSSSDGSHVLRVSVCSLSSTFLGSKVDGFLDSPSPVEGLQG